MAENLHYRYTNEQVAEDSELYYSLATDYVLQYTGTFFLLCEYRDRVRAGYDLTVPMVRATLNCMLQDARVVNLPAPKFQVRRYDSNVRPISEYRGRRHRGRVDWGNPARDEDDPLGVYPEEEVRVETKRLVKVALRTKGEYGMSTAPSAYVFHLVHPNSHATYDKVDNNVTFKVWWRCKPGAHSMGRKHPLVFMDALEVAIHILQSGGALKMCRRCREHRGTTVEHEVLVAEAPTVFMDGQVGTADLYPLRAWHPRPR